MNKNLSKCEPVAPKPNFLIGSKDGFESVHEYRILLGMLYRAYSGVDITKEFPLDLRYIFGVGGRSDGGNNYKYLKNACKTIVRRAINILPDNDSGFRYRNVVSMAAYSPIENPSEIIVQFNPYIVPYIINMFKRDSDGYTKILLRYSLPIRSLYSVRLYEYLLRNKHKKKMLISLKDLRKILGVPNTAYIMWSEFDRNVLKLAQKNMKKYTNLIFEYHGKRASRKITSILLLVSDNIPSFNCNWIPKPNIVENPPVFNNDESPEHIKIVKENIWEKSQKEVLEKYPENMIVYYYTKLQKTITSGKNIIDIKSYFYTLLKKDIDDFKSIEVAEQLKKKKQEAAIEEKKKLQKEAEEAKEKQDNAIALAARYLSLLPAKDYNSYMFNQKIPTFLSDESRREAAAELLLRDNIDLFENNPDESTFLKSYRCK